MVVFFLNSFPKIISITVVTRATLGRVTVANQLRVLSGCTHKGFFLIPETSGAYGDAVLHLHRPGSVWPPRVLWLRKGELERLRVVLGEASSPSPRHWPARSSHMVSVNCRGGWAM